jgi:glycine/D-amino acid oxidase-like deaminating enzyme
MSNSNRLRVAVLGAGGVGACTALELASHGCRVDLYEQDSQPLMRASRINEGKIHRGFLYAHDRSLRDGAIDGARRIGVLGLPLPVDRSRDGAAPPVDAVCLRRAQGHDGRP